MPGDTVRRDEATDMVAELTTGQAANGPPNLRPVNVTGAMVSDIPDMSTADAVALQWGGTGTADHSWAALDAFEGYFQPRKTNSGKVLGAAKVSRVRIAQGDDNGTAGHWWRLPCGNNGSSGPDAATAAA
ncbi:hypothetical protein [Paractinoplanes abujensis]|uniref:Uncharacterized protein n=1 Tax=Paractinoplanes abujensis TaxID=882441 RepID=A0A7W7CMX5_9ACTN|nr:hypothetical protein [Actinoplanes abujensis]MBB4691487.1 hypothetical protein [Actinoplanes abujensis]